MDGSAEFEEAGVRLFGVSRDTPCTHGGWWQVLDLNFPLLADWNGEAVHALGIGFELRGLQDVAGRSAFLVDEGVRSAAHGATRLERCPTSTCARGRSGALGLACALYLAAGALAVSPALWDAPDELLAYGKPARTS